MNRFRIARGREEDFLEVWRNRDSHLDEVPGFNEFKMLQGDKQNDHTVFISRSVWDREKAFRAWTQSEAFRRAHANAKSPSGIYLGPRSSKGMKWCFDASLSNHSFNAAAYERQCCVGPLLKVGERKPTTYG